MHEYGIVSNIIETADKIVIKEKINNIKRINVAIGKMNWIYPEVLYDCFNMIIKNTKFEKSKLNIISVDAIIECKECHSKSKLTEPLFICSECLSRDVFVVSGNELYIDSIEY